MDSIIYEDIFKELYELQEEFYPEKKSVSLLCQKPADILAVKVATCSNGVNPCLSIDVEETPFYKSPLPTFSQGFLENLLSKTEVKQTENEPIYYGLIPIS